MKHICIVGGGINGLMTAYYLRNNYTKITIIEKNPYLCSESSFHNAGTLFFSRIKPVFSNVSVIKTIIKQSKTLNISKLLSISKWGLCNTINNIFYDPNKYQFIRNNCKIEFDIKIAQKKSMFFGLQKGIYMSFKSNKKLMSEIYQSNSYYEIKNKNNLYLPDDYSYNTHTFSKKIETELLKYNIEILTNTKVEYMNIDNDGHIISVKTPDREIKADVFILCTNNNVFNVRNNNISKKIYLPLLKISGLSWTFNLNDNKNLNTLKETKELYKILDNQKCNTYVDGDNNIFYTRYNNILRVTYGYFIKPDLSYLINNYPKIIPEFPFLHDLCIKTKPTICNRFVSPDGLPLIGKHDDFDNLYINTGHGFLGWTMSFYSAKYLKNIITINNLSDKYIKLLSPHRFIFKNIT
tara:strand:- start:673 stop:1899 length:1227 start_codon:yes stop_codon:yes gene_type:complete